MSEQRRIPKAKLKVVMRVSATLVVACSECTLHSLRRLEKKPCGGVCVLIPLVVNSRMSERPGILPLPTVALDIADVVA